jgi:phosphate:Na+ symporter
MVIGANIGTTVTPMVAAIGATPNARRAASAHVVFNVLTGVVALLLLPWIVGALHHGGELLGGRTGPAATLALFHTTFNLLGVLLMWPIADTLTGWLQRRFRVREQDAGQSQFLDETVLPVPTLALDALSRELARAGAMAERMTGAALAGSPAATLGPDHRSLESLGRAVDRFVERLRAAPMSRTASAELAVLLDIGRCYQEAAEQACLAAELPRLSASDSALAGVWTAFEGALTEVSRCCDPPGAVDASRLDAALALADACHEAMNAELLAAGADGRLALGSMEQALRRGSALRRAFRLLAKARRRTSEAAGGSR